jgi:hypothetical protein
MPEGEQARRPVGAMACPVEGGRMANIGELRPGLAIGPKGCCKSGSWAELGAGPKGFVGLEPQKE